MEVYNFPQEKIYLKLFPFCCLKAKPLEEQSFFELRTIARIRAKTLEEQSFVELQTIARIIYLYSPLYTYT